MACIITVQPQVFLGSDVAFEEFVLRNKICFYPDPHVTTCELSLTPSYTILHPSQKGPSQTATSSAPRTLNNRIVSEDSDEPQTKAAWDARLTARNHAAQGPGEAAQGPGPTTKDAAGHASSFPSVDAVHRMAAATAMNFIERWYRKNVCCAVCERSHAT